MKLSSPIILVAFAAATVVLPTAWTTIATLTAPLSGLVEYQDVSGPTRQSFYRTVQP